MRKDCWYRWTVERPAAFGDWLWLMLVARPAELLDRLTPRKILTFLPVALLAIAFAQTLPLDLAILFAGDTVMYLEALTILSLLAAGGRARSIFRAVRRESRAAIQFVARRFAQAMRRERFLETRVKERKSWRPRPGVSEATDDESGRWRPCPSEYAAA